MKAVQMEPERLEERIRETVLYYQFSARCIDNFKIQPSGDKLFQILNYNIDYN